MEGNCKDIDCNCKETDKNAKILEFIKAVDDYLTIWYNFIKETNNATTKH